MIREIVRERETLRQSLLQLPMVEYIYPSDANFLLVKVDDPRAVYNYLLENGIVVRDRSRVELCEGCLRITVGTPDENNILVTALNERAIINR
jgi:histidinol-phosphate aminotransferase